MGHGAKSIGKFHRFLHKKLFRRSFSKTVKGTGVDWTNGYDVRNTIGPIAIKDQGSNDSCGGQAGSYFLEIQRRLQKITEGAISAKSIYAPIADVGGGTTVPQLINQIATKGANLEKQIPSYDTYGTPLSEAMMIEQSWITPAILTDAATRSGYTPYDVKVDIDTVAQVIQDWGAVIMEIQGQNGHNPGWESPTPVPPSKDNLNEIWAHFMCLIGFKMIGGKKYIISLQSEGQSWGEMGIQYISEDYFLSGFIVDTFTLCYDARLVPNSDNFSPWSWWWRWFKIKLGLSTVIPSKA